MKILLIFLTFITISGCSKSKTVLICGDHVCVNNNEAQEYFEENLTLEVQINDNKKDENLNLVELNLNTKLDGKREISISEKDKPSKKLKVLSKIETKNLIAELKQKKKRKKDKEKILKIDKTVTLNKKEKKVSSKLNIFKKSNSNIQSNKINDICLVLKKCDISEISKYLIKLGEKKNFPDITIRE